jgi:hypothetical protein
VFEANKLMVKDADGTERFESAAGTHFKDGSMEADLVSSDELSVWIKYDHCPVVYFCPRLYTRVVLSDLVPLFVSTFAAYATAVGDFQCESLCHFTG